MRWAAIAVIASVGCTKPGQAPDAGQHAPPPSASSVPTAARVADGGNVPSTDTIPSSAGPIRITPLHHASLLLELGDHGAVYVDPTAESLRDGLPKAEAIFITDIHKDHFDLAGIERVRGENTVIVAPPAVVAELPKTLAHVYALKNGERTSEKELAVPKLGFSFGFAAVPMYNIVRGPGPGKFYHDKGRGNGYVIEWGDKRIYVSGDTECTSEMKALERIDVAFVCMNLPYTMPPSEAAECIKTFKPAIVYPYHFRGSNLDVLTKALAGEPVEVRVRNWY